jgi:serine/threonine protein kinase
MTLAVGGIVGGYQIEEAVGSDVLGTVHRGRHLESTRVVLVRLLPLLGADPAAAVRFQRALEVVARLRHPAVAAVLAWGAHDGMPYVVSDDGTAHEAPVERLADRLASRSRPDPAIAMAMLYGLAQGIDHLHDVGVVHGDIAPSTVLFGREGIAKLTDVALGRATLCAGRPADGTDCRCVSPAHAAPERTEGEPPRPAEDVYAFAALAYELLTGSPPRRSATGVERPSAIARDLPAPVNAVLLRGLATNPAARWDTCVELAAALGSALRRRPPAPPAAPSPPRPPLETPGPRRARRPSLVTGLGAILAGVVSLGLGTVAAGMAGLAPSLGGASSVMTAHAANPSRSASPVPDPIAAPVAASTVSIALSAGTPRRAQWITVQGAGFDARQQFLVRVVQGDREWQVQSPTSPRGDGTFAIPVQVPTDAATGGGAVVACVFVVNHGPTTDCGRRSVVIQP